MFVPFNTAYKGRLLEHVLRNADARLLVAHRDLIARLADVDTATLSAVVSVAGAPHSSALPWQTFAANSAASAELPELARPIEPWDNQSIVYTSGTTGPSKGVLSSYLHLFTSAGPETWPFVRASDRFLVNMPPFHVGGMGIVNAMLARGGSIAVMENFATERFWPFVARTQTTAAFLLGVMATFLLKQEPGAQDSNHSLRLAFIVPMTEAADALHERFGIDIYTIFNMTEISSPIVSDANPTRRGVRGKPRAGVDVRLVDEHDCEVAPGEIGELLVRGDRPWGMNSGYYKNPEATAAAWRNGWFRTKASAAPRGRHRGHLGPRGRGPARQARGARRLNQPRFFSRRWRQEASWRW